MLSNEELEAKIRALEIKVLEKPNKPTQLIVDRIPSNANTYEIKEAIFPGHNRLAITAPGVTDDISKGYLVGSMWINTAATPRTVYVCTNNTFGAAVWLNVTDAFAEGNRAISAWIDPTAASTTVAKIIIGPLPVAGQFVQAIIKCKEGETCGATSQIVDIHLQTAANNNTDTSATIFSSKPTLTNGNKYAASSSFSTASFAANDLLYIYSDQLGTGLTALNITLQVSVT